jgi:hypothetical protein
MRRALLSWTLVFALLAAGFGASVLALNGDLFSAHGFVRSYLEALQSGDAQAALETPGVEGASALVTNETVGGFDDIHLLSDVETEGTNTVRYAYTIAGTEQVTEFHVERTGTRLGLFATWRFAVSPIATLAVTVDHDTRFSINGVDAAAGTYALLVPNAVTLTHDTTYLEALPMTANLIEVNSTVEAAVAVAPKDGFTEAATAAIAGFLDACAIQQVLKPTGCPFGTDVVNRLKTLPQWSITSYPTASLTPAGARWQTAGSGEAHISVEVQSLFDGTLSTLDDDVPFTASYFVTINADDSLTVTSA